MKVGREAFGGGGNVLEMEALGRSALRASVPSGQGAGGGWGGVPAAWAPALMSTAGL